MSPATAMILDATEKVILARESTMRLREIAPMTFAVNSELALAIYAIYSPLRDAAITLRALCPEVKP